MKLLSLKLANFKGVRELTILTSGGDVSIYGDNGTGKTTVADAVYWLLFDKDSKNRKDFEIKTIDANGQPVHRLEHRVEGEFENEGRTITLAKVYKEKWVKNRGALDAEFGGHTTDYWVNGVPTTAGEYQKAIASIADETQFRLLSDVAYFNESLKWQDRRRMLLEICGDVSDEAVIASNMALEPLRAALAIRSIDDHRKIKQAEIKSIKDQIAAIPIKVGELQRTALVDAKPKDVSALQGELSNVQGELVVLRSGGEAGALQKQISEQRAKVASVKADVAEKWHESKREEMQQSIALANTANTLQLTVQSLESQIKRAESEIDGLESRNAELKAEYNSVGAQVWQGEETCSACQQPLPSDRIETAKAAFNRGKAERLESIKRSGLNLKADIETLRAKIEGWNVELEAARKSFALASAKAQDSRKESVQPIFEHDPRVMDELRILAELESKLSAASINQSGAESQMGERIRALESQIAEAQSHNARINESAKIQNRIEELEQENTKLAGLFEDAQREIFLTEEFIRAKVKLLTERINGFFKIARFKLFDVQVNGAIAECCEATVDGVPYGSLNNGMRINVGLDIINTLAEVAKFAPPICIDNAESITKILPTRGHQIRLVVSATDPALRIETSAQQQEQLA